MGSLPLPNLLDPWLFIGSLNPSLIQGIVIGGIVFVVVILLGFSRRYVISESLRGVWAGFVVGVIAVLAIEGLIFWGTKGFLSSPKSAFLPESIRLTLANSPENLTKVLGIGTEKSRPTAQSVVLDFNSLPKIDIDLAKNSICKVEK